MSFPSRLTRWSPSSRHSSRIPILILITGAAFALSGCGDSLTGPRHPGNESAALGGDEDALLTENVLLTPEAVEGSTGKKENFVTLDVGEYDSEVAVVWFDLAYDLVKAENLSPPVAARVYAYAGVTLYEALVPGMPGHRSLANQLNGLSPIHPSGNLRYHWPSVANEALATVLTDLFAGGTPATLAAISDLRNQFAGEFQADVPYGIFRRSVAKGVIVGRRISDWAHEDGYEEFSNCAYKPPVGEGLWRPTPPGFLPALQPCWGELRPMALRQGDACDPGAPIAFSEDPGSPFYQEAFEVYQTVNNLTPEQQTIARFWADPAGQTGTPPGHSMSIAGQILTQHAFRLDVAAETFAKVGIAVNDAFISCWVAKYQYNLLRPVTYIRDVIDPAWSSFIGTPPFPEYTSGHSVQSAATAEVLTNLFGEIPFTDHTHDDRGFAPRSFDNFFDFADEAAISRLYGGIHFRAAIERGLEEGRRVGEIVDDLEFRDHSAGSPLAVIGAKPSAK